MIRPPETRTERNPSLPILFCPDSPCPTAARRLRGMKNLLSLWSHGVEAVASFGQATLHRRADGRYELAGGTPADRADALEWASLFQHDAVFTHRPEVKRSALPAPSPRC